MNEPITNLIGVINQNMAFVAQLAADVSALKTVVAAFSPEAAAALGEQIEIERAKAQEHIKGLQMLQSALMVDPSKITNQH